MSKYIKTDTIQYKLGQNIARLRKESGLTHADMDMYNISRAYYGKIELGSYSISIEKLYMISKAFGVPLYQLFIDKDGKPIE